MKKRSLFGLVALLTLFGCSSSKEVVPDLPPAQLYAQANEALQGGYLTTAIEKLEALDSRYPFGAYSDQVQLDLIYAYYRNDQLPLALASIDRFTRLNPTSKKLDWVLYMRGLTHMAQDTNFLQETFDVDRSDRDPTPAVAAFSDFKKLLTRYPHSQYAADSAKRLYSLKNRLANYELATAQFYVKRKAWIAAINRAQQLQKAYPDTDAARKALQLQLEAYKKLDLKTPTANTEQMIKLNP